MFLPSVADYATNESPKASFVFRCYSSLTMRRPLEEKIIFFTPVRATAYKLHQVTLRSLALPLEKQDIPGRPRSLKN
jgi:hypothetical protein